MSPTRYTQNVSICDEVKEKEFTCHTKPYSVKLYKADAVSQNPSALLVQSAGLAIDLINWSWDKVQFMQHNNLQNVHRVSQNVLGERKNTELNGCSTALEPVTDKQRRLPMYQVSGQNVLCYWYLRYSTCKTYARQLVLLSLSVVRCQHRSRK